MCIAGHRYYLSVTKLVDMNDMLVHCGLKKELANVHRI
jgi:hypothetical protein